MSTVSSFFEVNGILLDVTDDELIEIGMVLASDERKYGRLLKWIKEHEI